MKRVADWLADNVKTILVVALVILATDSGPALGSVVGYWRMETDTDTGAAVSVPNEIVGGNPLTTSVAQLYGAVPVDPVPLTGQANSYSINPNSQSIEGIVNPYAALDADSITVEFYARTTEGAGDLVTRTYGSAGFKITDFNSVDVTYYVDDGGGGSQAVTINTSHDMDADWDHMAWTYDQSTGVGRFFANGQQVGTSSSTTPRPGAGVDRGGQHHRRSRHVGRRLSRRHVRRVANQRRSTRSAGHAWQPPPAFPGRLRR